LEGGTAKSFKHLHIITATAATWSDYAIATAVNKAGYCNNLLYLNS